MLILIFATTSAFALMLDSSPLLCNQTVCKLVNYPRWLPMGYLPYESHWGEFNCDQKNPQIESYLLPGARLSFGTV